MSESNTKTKQPRSLHTKKYLERKERVERIFELARQKPSPELPDVSKPVRVCRGSNARAERDVAQVVGTGVSIVGVDKLNTNLGQDEFDRAIAEEACLANWAKKGKRH